MGNSFLSLHAVLRDAPHAAQNKAPTTTTTTTALERKKKKNCCCCCCCSCSLKKNNVEQEQRRPRGGAKPRGRRVGTERFSGGVLGLPGPKPVRANAKRKLRRGVRDFRTAVYR